MKQSYWHIKGYDGLAKIYDRKVKSGYYGENQVQLLVQVLAAKAGLSFDEIVGAYARKRSKISNDLLSVRRDGRGPVFTCGENPHFIARYCRRLAQSFSSARR
jgi:hypothetical protein